MSTPRSSKTRIHGNLTDINEVYPHAVPTDDRGRRANACLFANIEDRMRLASIEFQDAIEALRGELMRAAADRQEEMNVLQTEVQLLKKDIRMMVTMFLCLCMVIIIVWQLE